MKNCWASSTWTMFFPLTDYMDCYRPQVCTQCLHKAIADKFFSHFCRPLRGTSHSSWEIRPPRSGTGNLCISSAGLHESRRVCWFFDIPQSILIPPSQDTANVFIGQVQRQVVFSWRYSSYIFDQPCRPVQIYSNRHLISLVATAHAWTLWRPYNYYHPLWQQMI